MTRIESHVFQMLGGSRTVIKNATVAFHKLIHEIQQTTEYQKACYYVQPPSKVLDMETVVVHCKAGTRPYISLPGIAPSQFEAAVSARLDQFTEGLSEAADVLTALDTQLRMRVSLGKLFIRDDGISPVAKGSYETLSKLMDEFSENGGARFESRYVVGFLLFDNY